MEDEEVPPGKLLEIANNILALQGYKSRIENEEDLFLDQFYIAIISNLESERKFDIEPGRNKDEMVKSLNKLMDFLSQFIIDIDFNVISTEGIIKHHDRASARLLLELIEEFIKVLIEQNQVEEDENNDKSHSISKNSEQSKSKIEDLESISNSQAKQMNNSDGQIARKRDNLDQSEELQNPELQGSSGKKYSNFDIESERQEQNESDLLIRNHSAIEPLDIEKLVQSQQENSYEKRNLTQNDLSNFEKRLQEAELEAEEDEVNYDMKYPGQNLMGIEQEGDNDVSLVKNVSHISEVSKSKENSEQQKLLKNSNKLSGLSNKNKESDQFKNSDYGFGNEDEMKQSDLDNHNKHNDINDIRNDMKNEDEDDKIEVEEQSAYSMPILQPGIRLSETDNSLNTTNKNYDNEDGGYGEGDNYYNDNDNEDYEEGEEGEEGEGEEETMGNNNEKTENKKSEMRTSGKNSSQKGSKETAKKESNKKSSNENNNNNNENNISQSSEHSNQQKSTNQSKINDSTSGIVDQLEMNPEELKYEIIKQLRRLYGDKLEKVMSKHIAQQSDNVFELILRNIKLAKQKTIRIANRINDPDDLKTKDYVRKYERELEYIVKYYSGERKKREFFQDRALRAMQQNMNVMKKVQEIQARKMESEIERRKKAREVRKQHNQARLCNEIYSLAFQKEKEKYLEEQKIQAEIRQRENEEKRRQFEALEKFYNDKINLLKEYLKNEKEEREIMYRARVVQMSKLERERKEQYKQEIDHVFDRFEEEDKRAEFLDNDKDQINKILENYYK